MLANSPFFNVISLHYVTVVETNLTYEPNCSANENNTGDRKIRGALQDQIPVFPEAKQDCFLTPSGHGGEVCL